MTAPAAPLSTGRRIAIWTLVVLATILTLLSSLTLWVKRQALDNSEWRKASADVIADQQIRDALSVYLVNQLYDNVDVAQALRQRLPDNLQALATPAAAALREPAAQAATFMLARPRVQTLFVDASANAHQKLVNVLEDKTGYGISTGTGVVTLDLAELVTQLGTELGVPPALLAKIPPDAGQITLMKSSQLGAAQDAVQIIRVLSVWLLIIVLVLYGSALYLARGERRTTLRTIGWAFVLVGVLVLVVRKLAGNYVVDALTSPTYKVTVHHAWLIGTSLLGSIGWGAVFYGIVVVLGATLAGPTRVAAETRRVIAPVLNERQAIAWSVVGFLFLLLVLWGPTHAFRTWWGVLLFAALLAAGVVALRRQTLTEAAAGVPSPGEPPAGEKGEPGQPAVP